MAAKPDFSFANHGSICTLVPLTIDATEWIDEHIPDNGELQHWCGGIVIEPRYAFHGSSRMDLPGVETPSAIVRFKFPYRAMHLTQATQFVVAGSWQRIHARCWNFAIGSLTMQHARTISPSCGGRKGSAARYAGDRIIGLRRGACVTARGADGRPR